MKYFRRPDGNVSGYDETEETQLPYIEAAIKAGWTDVSNSWPPLRAPSHNEIVLFQIAELEAKQTPRRLREAVKDPTWLNALDEQIAALRAQLIKETTNG